MRAFRLVILLLALQPQLAPASDACSGRAIVTAADVSVSDGTGFRTESFYRSKDSAAIRHIDQHNDNGDRIVAVEGPLGWARDGERAQLGSDFYKLFALGHQYHALLLEFDAIAGNIRNSAQVEFDGELREATSGDYPYGGTVHLIRGEEESRPAGMRFEFPEDTVIQTWFLDWRAHGNTLLPYHVRIDDGERTFDYHYTSIDISSESPLWFFESVPAPPLDEVEVYRLHRKLLAAHCIGDASMMARLSAPVIINANRGSVSEISNAAVEARFTSLFQSLDYTEYHDLSAPVIEVSDSSDIGWIAVNTRAIGKAQDSDKTFDDQWAWIMTVRKIDGRWLHAANASNRAE
jgi:hypothetical protein